MRTNPYKAYVEDEIMTADPVKLIQLLYRGAAEAISRARVELARGDIKARSASITKAIEILAELSSSLNHERGGEISARLAALYDYMQRRLVEANGEQADAPLAEVERLLRTIEEAWAGVEMPATEENRGSQVIPDGNALNPMPPAEYVPISCAY